MLIYEREDGEARNFEITRGEMNLNGYRKYVNFRSVIRNIILNRIKSVFGIIKWYSILSKNNKTHYIVLPKAIGDSVYALAYLQEYKLQHNIEHITIICTKNIEKICKFWHKEIDDIILVDRLTLAGLYGFGYTLPGQYLFSFRYRDIVTLTHYRSHMIQRGIWWNTVYHLNDFYKNVIYQIKPDSKVQFPELPYVDIQSYIDKYKLQRGKTVLLNPCANSVKGNVTPLFERIAESMSSKGYSVVTIVSNENDASIKGTAILPCNLAESYCLAEYCGTVIALRSGFLDFLVFANCQIIAVMDKDYGPKDFYKLEAWNVNKRCATIIYDGKNDDEVIDEMIGVLDSFSCMNS